MINLSRSGWNNVIIFAVMGFILLINLTHKDTSTTAPFTESEQFLFHDGDVILTLTINGGVAIERIGRTWRAAPAVIHGQLLDQMMMSWQKIKGGSITPPSNIDMQMGLTVSLAIAGQDELMVLRLFDYDNQLLIYRVNSEQWLMLPLEIFSQLLPSEVL